MLYHLLLCIRLLYMISLSTRKVSLLFFNKSCLDHLVLKRCHSKIFIVLVYEELYKTNEFQTMSATTDEDEHSIELHLPFVAKAMERWLVQMCSIMVSFSNIFCWRNLFVFCSRRGHFTIVPILVGSLSQEKQKLYGQLLHPYLADPDNFFVISSDFCHWGTIRN